MDYAPSSPNETMCYKLSSFRELSIYEENDKNGVEHSIHEYVSKEKQSIRWERTGIEITGSIEPKSGSNRLYWKEREEKENVPMKRENGEKRWMRTVRLRFN